MQTPFSYGSKYLPHGTDSAIINPWCKGHGKCDGGGAEPHSAVRTFQIGAIRITAGKDDDYRHSFEAYVLLESEICAGKIRDFPIRRFTPCGTMDARDGIAPHRMPRAALKRYVLNCYLAVSGIAPHRMPRAALKPSSTFSSIPAIILHHTECRVRH